MRTVFNRLLSDLKTIYTDEYFLPKDTFTQAADMWYQVLNGFTADQIRAAFNEYAKTHDRPPMPSQIRELIYDMSDEKREAPIFDPDRYWREFSYWVVTDQEGYHINEIITDASDTEDDVANHFKRLKQDMSGTVLKKVDFTKYRPKYRLPDDNKPSEEDIKKLFAHYDPIVTASPTIEDSEKRMAFEKRRQELLEQAKIFTQEETK